MKSTTVDVPRGADDNEYPLFLEALKGRFAGIVADGTPIYTTDAEGLSTLFLEGLPPEARPTYNCQTRLGERTPRST